jgi:signal transduction histidine kinase
MMLPPRAGSTIAAMRVASRPWLDPVLAALLTGFGVFITLVTSDSAPHTWVDSVVIAAVTLPVGWRRRAPIGAAVAFAAGAVISGIPTFDQIRCGAAIPAALLILFAIGARLDRPDALKGLLIVLAGVAFLLNTDSQVDVAGAVFIVPLCIGIWGMGTLVRSRSRVAADLAERSRELAHTREQRARIAVEVDRAAIAADLDATAGAPLRSIVELAGTGPASSEAFATIERQGRESLNELRDMLGALRSDQLETKPQPSLAQLDALLECARRGGATVELVTSGTRRPLPAGIELAAYRVVQHALESLRGGGAVRVELRYTTDALELDVSGPLEADVPLAAARERVTAHGGSFARERGGDRGWVLRSRLPLAAAGG